jgi:hypothetical protein
MGLLLFLIVGCSSINGNLRSDSEISTESLAAQWGIQVEMIALTAAGRMVDFRYRVIDEKKAVPVFDRNTKAYLIHQSTNQTLAVPTTAKVGPLRTTGTPEEGRVYWMFFGNPGVVKSGDRVNVVIGDVKISDLVVQ